MAYQFNVNQTPANAGGAVYALKVALLAAGWTVLASGDGTSYGASSDVVTDGTKMNTARAWIRVRMPGGAGAPELTIQRDPTNNLNWRIKYSFTSGFTAGSPSATITPSAADEVVLQGGGTDASPTGIALFAGADGTYRAHAMADDADGYGFYLFCVPTGGGAANGAFFHDPMTADSYPNTDVDPRVFYTKGTSPALTIATFQNNASSAYTPGSSMPPRCFLKKGLAGEGFVYIQPLALNYTSTSVYAPGGAPSNPHSGFDDEYPIIYARPAAYTAPSGHKGWSSLFKWKGANRTTLDVFTLATTNDLIVFGDLVAPWDGSSPTV